MPSDVRDLVCPPLSVIGILGGGQLGRLLAQAASGLGFRTHIFAPESSPPARSVSTYFTCADYEDIDALTAFAAETDYITFEFENIPIDTLSFLSSRCGVSPSRDTLSITQDRLFEKEFLQAHDILTARWLRIDSRDSVIAAIASGADGILKTRRFGYDGKGQWRVGGNRSALPDINFRDMILEEVVDFSCELSVILARGRDGVIVSYDPIRNDHRDHILHRSVVPSGVESSVEVRARAIARQIADALSYIGVLAVEFFVGRGGDSDQDSGVPLYVNEIAPRVHNSGHWTLDACCVSQFEQHIRAITGWSLGDGSRHSDAEMINLIGSEIDDWQKISAAAGTALHIYGKHETRAGRKMGHMTRLMRRSD